jgi:hypothetical protein
MRHITGHHARYRGVKGGVIEVRQYIRQPYGRSPPFVNRKLMHAIGGVTNDVAHPFGNRKQGSGR